MKLLRLIVILSEKKSLEAILEGMRQKFTEEILDKINGTFPAGNARKILVENPG